MTDTSQNPTDGSNDAGTLGIRLVRGNTDRIFGGSVVAGIMLAAGGAAHPLGRVHSVHTHFLRAGVSTKPVDITTRAQRSSRAFTTVSVQMTQSRRVMASGVVSFHTPEITRAHGPTSASSPRAPQRSAPAKGGAIPETDSPSRSPFDLRDAGHGTKDPDGRPVLRYWVRRREPVVGSTANAAALAWVSDLCLTRVADLEHEHSPGIRQAASLDHAMWFHAEILADQWMLYELTSPVYRDGLALSTGRFYDENGQLVASVAQESLLRRVDIVRS